MPCAHQRRHWVLGKVDQVRESTKVRQVSTFDGKRRTISIFTFLTLRAQFWNSPTRSWEQQEPEKFDRALLGPS